MGLVSIVEICLSSSVVFVAFERLDRIQQSVKTRLAVKNSHVGNDATPL